MMKITEIKEIANPMKSERCFPKVYLETGTLQTLSDVRNSQWLDEMEKMIETTVIGLRKESCTCSYVQNFQNGRLADETGNVTRISVNRFTKDWGRWLDTRSDRWLEEVGDMIETTVNGIKKDSCNCYMSDQR
jgi:hypothetical protein